MGNPLAWANKRLGLSKPLGTIAKVAPIAGAVFGGPAGAAIGSAVGAAAGAAERKKTPTSTTSKFGAAFDRLQGDSAGFGASEAKTQADQSAAGFRSAAKQYRNRATNPLTYAPEDNLALGMGQAAAARGAEQLRSRIMAGAARSGIPTVSSGMVGANVGAEATRQAIGASVAAQLQAARLAQMRQAEEQAMQFDAQVAGQDLGIYNQREAMRQQLLRYLSDVFNNRGMADQQRADNRNAQTGQLIGALAQAYGMYRGGGN